MKPREKGIEPLRGTPTPSLGNPRFPTRRVARGSFLLGVPLGPLPATIKEQQNILRTEDVLLFVETGGISLLGR